MYKKTTFVVTLFSTSIFSLDLNKEFNDLGKTAKNIALDSWQRASFEDNIFTKLKHADKSYARMCDERLKKEIDQQLSQDGKNLLKLAIAGAVIKAVEKTIEYSARLIVDDARASDLSQAITVAPKLITEVVTFPLFLNFIFSLIVKGVIYDQENREK